MLKSIGTLLFVLLFTLGSKAQKAEYVYKNPKDSSFNCYLKIIPEGRKMSGLIIRDFTRLPDTAKKSRYPFTELCKK